MKTYLTKQQVGDAWHAGPRILATSFEEALGITERIPTVVVEGELQEDETPSDQWGDWLRCVEALIREQEDRQAFIQETARAIYKEIPGNGLAWDQLPHEHKVPYYKALKAVVRKLRTLED